MKYSLPTGEVVDLDLDDILEIDFTTIKGKETIQEIYYMKDRIKKYTDFDEAIEFDTLKFFDKEKPSPKSVNELDEDIEGESNEDYHSDIYIESIKQQSGEE